MPETNIVASALELLGWTQDTLADALNHEEGDGKGVSAPTIWRWMTGRTGGSGVGEGFPSAPNLCDVGH